MISARTFMAVLTALLVGLASASQASGKPPSFRREWLQPYLGKGLAARARLQLQARAAAKAARLLRKLTGGAESLQARYLLAHALLSSNQLADAAKLFAQLTKDYPLLADYCRFHEAQARFRQRDFAAAEKLAGAIPQGSVLQIEAQLLRGEALHVLGRWSEAPAAWEAYLKRHPRGARVGHVELRLGQALEKVAAGLPAGAERSRVLERALERYKQAVIRTPLSPDFAEASGRLQALAANLSDGASRAQLDGWQRLEQAHAYFRAQRNSQAEAAYAEILRDKTLSPRLRCKATFYQAKSVFKQRQRARAVPLYQAAVTACRGAGEAELTVKSLFDLAKGLMRAQRPKEAIARLAELEKEFPRHSYADDARLWAAEAYQNLQQPAQVTRLLTSLPTLYPQGDMTHEALWRLARQAYLEQKPKAALQHLERALSLGRPRYYYSTGQALYWKARILEKQKQRAEALKSYERCIRDYPLSYYSLLAFNRLRERHPAKYRALARELLAPPGAAVHRWRFSPQTLFGEAGFLRGLELARLGFSEAAAQELSRVGLGRGAALPAGVGAAAEDSDDRWLPAVLYDRAGLWHLSHRLPPSIDPQLRRSYPLGQHWRGWALTYPRAFSEQVLGAARDADVPAELVYSIMREESGFSPTIESYANAVGLMQLILPTARAAGRQHKLQVTRETLRDPAQNVRLGATFLGFLVSTFRRTLPLAVAGYNAGEGAVFRWLRQFGGAPLDEFIERIPYDQTRRYTKRVLATLFTYCVLYRRGEGRVPKLPQAIPKITARAFGS